MHIVDAHLDLAWNALQWNRDITRSVYSLRPQEFGMEGPGRTMNTVALPEMHQGRIALSIATLLARSTGTVVPYIDYATSQQAFAIARGQLAYYRALEASGHIRITTDIDSLNAHLSAWEQDSIPGIVISMESADSIIEPDTLQEWWKLGVRLIGPAHYGMGRYAGGTSVEDGLTDLGVHLLKEMAHLNIILDMTHLSDKAFWQALDHYDGLVIASHNNCRALVPGQRQFSDEQLQAIIARGGAIGVSLDAWMLKPGWIKDKTTNEDVTLASVVDHIDHICQLAGNANHAAIGSDLDGGFGREQSPSDLDTIADLQKLIPLMQNRGYSEKDVAAIMHGNWLGILRKVWEK